MAKRLIVLDYDAVRAAFDEEYKATRKLIESGEDHLDNLAEGFTEADRVLRGMLTVDAVEVVICDECKHSEECEDIGWYWCNYHGDLTMRNNDFCSYGERKE